MLFAFPPSSLVRGVVEVLAVVEKECADQVLCVLVVPVAVLAPHWDKMLATSALPRDAQYAYGFVRIRDSALILLWLDPSAPA